MPKGRIYNLYIYNKNKSLIMNEDDLKKAWAPIMIKLSVKLELEQIMKDNNLKSITKTIQFIIDNYKK